MTIPAKTFYEAGCPQFSSSEIWSHQSKAGEYLLGAARQNLSLPGRVVAQWNMIQAQKEMSKAEYLSYQICPRSQVLKKMDQQLRRQAGRLEGLRERLYGTGFFDMYKKYGIAGVSAYFFTIWK